MSKGYSSEQKLGKQSHQTIQPIGTGKFAQDMIPKALYPLQALDFVPTNGTIKSLEIIGHSAAVGDVVRFTAGAYDGAEATITAVDANNLYFSHKFATALSAVDTCQIMRPITLTIDKAGALSTSSGPIQFIKDAIVQQVIEDTVTPSNNAPLPVKLTNLAGDINVTAGDLHVQLSHLGATADSARIGDGTNELGITASNEAQVKDADLLVQSLLHTTSLSNLDGKDFATEVTSAAILAKLIASPSTEAKQDTSNTALASILAKLIAAPATEAKQDNIITELQSLVAASNKEVEESIFIQSAALNTSTYLGVGTAIPAGVTLKEIEVFYKDGSTIEVFDADGGNSLGMVTQAGGKIPVNLVGDNVLRVHLRVLGTNVTVDDLTVNLIK